MLETERLILRPWRTEDARVHRELWTERDPRVPAHRRISADGRPTVAELQEWSRASADAGPIRLLVVELKTDRAVVGYCGTVENAELPDGEPELAFELLRRHWGNGYATEAASAVVDRARAAGHQRLWATVREWNTASRRVLAKLGFVETDRVVVDHVHGSSIFMTLKL